MTIKRSPLTGLLAIVFTILIGIAITNLYGLLGFIVSVIIILVTIFLVLYFIWAPENIIGFFPKEGYCTIITEGDAFSDAIIKYRNKILRVDYKVIDSNDPDKKNHKKAPFSLFGMCFIPWWPLRKVYKKEVKWTKLVEGEIQHRKEVLERFSLMDYLYYVECDDEETTNKITIKIGLNVVASIINPYLAIFKTSNLPAMLDSEVKNAVRNFIRTKSYEKIIDSDLVAEILSSMGSEIRDMEDRYGLFISNIKVIAVEPTDKEYAKATTQKTIVEKRVEANIVEAQGKALVAGLGMTGAIMAMLSSFTGEDVKKLQGILKDDPKFFEENYGKILEYCQKLYEKSLAITGGSYLEVVSSGGGSSGSIDGNLLALMVTANKISGGKGGISDVPKKQRTKEEMDNIVYGKD